MNLIQQQTLDENFGVLIQAFNPMDVMKILIEKGIMTNNERRELVETQNDQRVSVFLSILKKKGSEVFPVFIEVLAAFGCYRDLAEKLQSDEKSKKERATACEQRITGNPALRDDPFMFLDFVFNIAELLELHEVLKLCEYLQFGYLVTNRISRSTFSGLEFMTECRRKKVISSTNASDLQHAFDTLGMTHLNTITKDFMEMMSNPEFHICISSSSPPTLLDELKRMLSLNKISFFRKHRLFAYFFREKYKANLDSIKDGSLLLVLRKSRETFYESLVTQVISGELAKDLLPVLLSGTVISERNYGMFKSGNLSITLDPVVEKVTTDDVRERKKQKREPPSLDKAAFSPSLNISEQKEGHRTMDYQRMKSFEWWDAVIETVPNKGFVCGQGFKVVVRCHNLPSGELIDIGISELNVQNKTVFKGQETEFVIEAYGKFTIIASVQNKHLTSKDISVRPCETILSDYHGHVQPYDALLDSERNVLIILKEDNIITCSPPNFEQNVMYTEDNFIPFAITSLDSFYFVTVTNQKKIRKFGKNFLPSHTFGHEYLTAPTGITAMETSKKLFVANKCEKQEDVPSILIFNAEGQFLKRFANDIVKNPWSVKINEKDDILVSDVSKNCIYVFTSDNFTVKTKFKIQPYHGQEMQCRGMDIDGANNIFVAERGVGYRQQFERISIYTENFDTIGHICCSETAFPRLKRYFMGIPLIGSHVDSIVEDVISVFQPSDKKFNFVRGISNTVYQDQAVLLVVDAGNHAVRMISLSKKKTDS